MSSSSNGSPHDPDEVQLRIQRTLIKTSIALPLLHKMESAELIGKADTEFDVIIDANLDYPGSRSAAREWILKTLEYLIGQLQADTPRLIMHSTQRHSQMMHHSQQK